jgi:hypothetical protein
MLPPDLILWLLICGSGAFSLRQHIDKLPVRPAA